MSAAADAVPAAPKESALRRFRRAFEQPSAWTVCVLGFGSGLPFLLVGGTLGYWFREGGMSLRDIGLVSWISLLYVFKFLWAPLLDRAPPAFIARLGRRRGWLLLSQLCVAIGLAGMAALGPGANLALFLLGLTWTTFAGATQDCVVDAYRIEIAPVDQQGALITTYSLGYRVGLVLAGAGALYSADMLGWPSTYLALAALMLLPVLVTLMAPEPELPAGSSLTPAAAATTNKRGFALMWHALVEYFRPVIEFFRRNGWRLASLLLLFVGLYKLPDQIIGVMAGPFYLDLGFSKTQIATVSKVYGVWLGFAGALLGGMAATLLGVRRSLLVAALGVALSNLAFLLMAAHPGEQWSFVAAISADNFCQGFAGSVLVAFMSSLADVRFSATQYALLASLANMLGKVLGGVTGFFVEAFGYSLFFALSAASILPTLWLYWRLRAHMPGPSG